MESVLNKRIPVLRFKDDRGEEYPEWEFKTLGEVGEVIGGGTPDTNDPKLWSGSIIWFTPVEINEKYSSRSIRKISMEGLKQSSAKILPAGAVLLTTRATIGKVTITTNECTTNQGFQSFVVNGSNFSNEFLYYWLTKNVNEFIRRANGSTYLEVSGKTIKKIVYSVPTLIEQQKIADFLSSIDTRIEQLEKRKALLEQFKKGLMQKLFSRTIRFRDERGEEYPEWEEKRLGQLFSISAGGDIEKHHLCKQKTEVFQYPVFANSTSCKGLRGYSDLYRIDQACVTVSGRGTLGIAHERTEKFYPIVRLLVLIPKLDCNLLFFEYAINELSIFNESTGVPQLTSPQLSKYRIKFPTINEQQRVADSLSSIDRKIELTNEQIDKTREFKKGLYQQMFV